MGIFKREQEIKPVHEVFGVSNTVLPDSYVDRGDLDEQITLLLDRPTHVALRGVSKCGKSWLRQTVLPDAIILQCRLGKTVIDLYREALGELGVRLEISTVASSGLVGKVEAGGEVGIKLLAKVTGKVAAEYSESDGTTTAPVSEDINDLRLVADLILASGRRLVIEDFHYLSIDERRKFAFDLKALWDFGVFVIIVGVWSAQNMLLYLNPDLTGRVQEIPIVWTHDDLSRIFANGAAALNISFFDDLEERAIADCYENAGILQTLILGTLDHVGVTETVASPLFIDDMDALEFAELQYAEQLNPLYQEFARRVSNGIRTRQNATGIYAHAMMAVISASDTDLVQGLPVAQIYADAHEREPRIQKGNLKTVLEKIESLQVDDDGRGLVFAYNDANGDVTVVDRQVLLYRRFSTVRWPWEDLISGAEAKGETFEDA
jgi:hypothetical protein